VGENKQKYMKPIINLKPKPLDKHPEQEICTSPTADKQCLMLARVSAARGRSPLANTSSTVELN